MNEGCGCIMRRRCSRWSFDASNRTRARALITSLRTRRRVMARDLVRLAARHDKAVSSACTCAVLSSRCRCLSVRRALFWSCVTFPCPDHQNPAVTVRPVTVHCKRAQYSGAVGSGAGLRLVCRSSENRADVESRAKKLFESAPEIFFSEVPRNPPCRIPLVHKDRFRAQDVRFRVQNAIDVGCGGLGFARDAFPRA
eukprot:5436162-Pyramimonas_sp.AAC.1